LENGSVKIPASAPVARDVMTSGVLSVPVGMPLRQIAKLLVENGISGVPVVDSDGLPIGMVTENDLIAPDGGGKGESGREWWLSQLAEGEPLSPQFLANLDRSERTARDIMASPVVSIAETTELSEIARLFTSYRVKRLPVVRDGRMVGIVSRSDLVRRMAAEPTQPVPIPRREGLLTGVVASLEAHFNLPEPLSATPPAQVDPPKDPTATASGFHALVDEFDHQKTVQHDEARQAVADQRKALVKDLIDRHVEPGSWRETLRRAQTAAEAGQKDVLLLRFPAELCSDGGRAINVPLPEWPETLRGEAAEIYLRWENELKPNGFHLFAQVLDFPGGMPGDIGLTLSWGG